MPEHGDFDYHGHGGVYSTIRRADPRIAAQIRTALGSARTVLNVGAGAGSYEPTNCHGTHSIRVWSSHTTGMLARSGANSYHIPVFVPEFRGQQALGCRALILTPPKELHEASLRC
jgi:hypothetical protein